MPPDAQAIQAAAAPVEPVGSLTRGLTVLFAFAVSIMIVNLTAAQPLAEPVARSLGLPASMTGLVATLPQLGYTLGMLFLVPLADLLENRRLAVATLAICAVMLVLGAVAPNAPVFLLAVCVAGATSCAIQVLVPLAASMAHPERRGSAVGNVMSGVMLGILFSRPLASVIAGHFGWRWFYALLGGLDVGLALVLWRNLPDRRPDFGHSYGALIGSLWSLWKGERVLRRYAISAAFVMAAFAAFWTGVAMLLVQAPFSLGADAMAAFALAGVAGTIVAPIAGKVGDKGHSVVGMRVAHIVLLAGVVLAGIAGAGWFGLDFTTHRYLALGLLVTAAIVIDAGAIGDQTIGRRAINMLIPEARSRLNGLFVGVFFIGGGIGAACAGIMWASHGWTGVCVACLVFVALAFACDAFARPESADA
ncbi:MFS transporter [Pinirhizobacter sp.]|jgi:predicted MFS family arabinose efflux permease|uniref:MFS transporter n=1 Tax=Pinirhizobacter sp. TaxID=2950432 RepID=UPI002F3E231D